MRSPEVFQGRRDCGSGLRAHLQVGGASDRSGPLDRDLQDPGLWGSMGTPVSQAPDRRVDVAAETMSC
jgi:hypothetical protein